MQAMNEHGFREGDGSSNIHEVILTTTSFHMYTHSQLNKQIQKKKGYTESFLYYCHNIKKVHLWSSIHGEGLFTLKEAQR